MLSSSDADLVRRDWQIPGLAVVLDPEAFANALQDRLPDLALAGVQPTYLRYKAGTSCLAGFRLDIAGEFVDVYARAMSLSRSSQLNDARRLEQSSEHESSLLGFDRLVLPDLAIGVSVFPDDDELDSLPLLALPEQRERMLTKILPDRPDLWKADVQRLRYKPERRFVGQLLESGDSGTHPVATLKMYCEADYRIAQANAKELRSGTTLRIAARLGRSNRHRVLVLEWMHGRLLQEMLADASGDRATIARCGAALAELHEQSAELLTPLTREAEAGTLIQVARGVGEVCPELAARAVNLAERLAEHLVDLPRHVRPIHGDFYAKQVIVADQTVAILDLDQAMAGDPASDLGLFAAHLESDAIRGHLPVHQVEYARDALFAGYAGATRRSLPRRVGLYVATGLLRLAPHPFRGRGSDWRDQTEVILRRAEEILGEFQKSISPASLAIPTGGVAIRPRPRLEDVEVSDYVGAGDDPEMPFLTMALDPIEVNRHFARNYSGITQKTGAVDVTAIRVVRHKAGRRCLIEYDMSVEKPEAQRETITMLGKARARGLDTTSFRLSERLWNDGFGSRSNDGVLVPEPIGTIPDFHMWLQRKAPGTVATCLLAGPGGPALVGRIAEAIHKLHVARVPSRRRHTMADELRIIHERLPRVSTRQPHLASRLERLLAACDRLGASVPEPVVRGIHRDFYPDQILVDDDRLFLLDLDLYCQGDPSLDVGNFIGHITELSLRTTGREDGLLECERAMEERFVELSGEATRAAARAYTTLTLVRHIHLSTRFPERQSLTEHLIDLCERRLFSSRGRLLRRSG